MNIEKSNKSLELQSYVNADHSNDQDNSKSIIRYVFTIIGTTMSWAS